MAHNRTYGSLRGIPAPVDRRPLPGAPVPLLERLVDDDPKTTTEARPYRSFDINGLRQSVLAELSRLFNTRAPVGEADLVRIPRTVITYGVPDFSTYTADGLEGHARFARHAVAAIEAFEPRLKAPRVTVQRDGNSRQPRWTAIIDGILDCGTLREPVRFEQSLSVQNGISG
jgi:type VI secretion system protein ImpF